MREKSSMNDQCSAAMVMGNGVAESDDAPFFIYEVECVGADGSVKWRESVKNLVTTAGKTDLIDKYFKGSAYTAAWYLGLKGAGAVAVGDTAASHAGWTEVTPYTGNRPAITFGTTAAGSNTATTVSFAITLAGPTTVAGGFVTNLATGNGVLYSAADFAHSRQVVLNDTLNVTLTVSAT